MYYKDHHFDTLYTLTVDAVKRILVCPLNCRLMFSLLFQQNSSFVDWSPIVNEEEEFELESSDYSEWDLITQSKKKEEEGDLFLITCPCYFAFQ